MLSLFLGSVLKDPYPLYKLSISIGVLFEICQKGNFEILTKIKRKENCFGEFFYFCPIFQMLTFQGEIIFFKFRFLSEF